MARSPINRCKECGKPIVRMRKRKLRNGYRLEWSRAGYCSNACKQAAYRRRKYKAKLHRIFGEH